MVICKSIIGTPKPQPRPRAFSRGGRAGVYNPKTADAWKATIAASLVEYRDLQLEGRIWLNLEFRMLRPKSHFGTGRNAENLKKQAPDHHIQKPDIDNLVKSTMDAITNLGLWRDDCQVDNLITRKVWVDDDPGVNIIIEQKTNKNNKK